MKCVKRLPLKLKGGEDSKILAISLLVGLGCAQIPRFRRELVNGQERTMWNPSLSIKANDHEFTDVEVSRIKAAIDTWDAYGASADRRWLEPLVTALFAAEGR